MYCVMRASVPSLYNVYRRLPLIAWYTLKLVEFAIIHKSNKPAEESYTHQSYIIRYGLMEVVGLARLSVGRAERSHTRQ